MMKPLVVLALVLMPLAGHNAGALVQAPRATFVGTTPCDEPIRAFIGGLPADARCHAIHWELTLGSADTPNRWSLNAVYGVPTASNPNAMADGPSVTKQGTLSTSARQRLGGKSQLFRLTSSDGARSIAFAQLGADLVNLASDDGSLSAGTAAFSYTLTRADRVEPAVIEVSRPAEGSYTVPPRESGPHVLGIFEGRSPCAGLTRALNLGDLGCVRLKWRVTLFEDPATNQPTTYRIDGTINRGHGWTGAWRIGRGAPGFPDAPVYQLDAEPTHGPIFLLRADENLLLFLDQQRQPLPGTADWSYTLAKTVRAAEPQAAEGSIESLTAWIDGVRREHRIPAMGAIVFRGGSVLARGIAGVRRSDAAASVEASDRFQLGSNTKAITATLLGTLVEEGKLSWTTTAGDVFPELKDAIAPEFRGATIELLLSHHGGVSAFEDTDAKDFRSIPRLSGTPTERRAAFAAWVLRGRPVGPVGASGKGLYSNGGYTIAAAIAERAAGDSWESLIRTRIFTRLGINGAFAWSDSPDANQPWGHYETRGGTKAVDPGDPDERVPPIIWPAGSVELSLDDYARFLQLNLRGLQGHDTSLLKAATIKRLHTSPVSPPDKYGLGWGLQDFDGAPASVHVGSAGTFYAITILQPTLDLGVAVFSNAGGERAAAATADAAKTLLRRFARPQGL